MSKTRKRERTWGDDDDFAKKPYSRHDDGLKDYRTEDKDRRSRRKQRHDDENDDSTE